MLANPVDEWPEREPSCAGALIGGAQSRNNVNNKTDDNANAKDDEIRAKLETIAREFLDLETLVERGRDRLDFHEHGVVSIAMALRAAFDAGRKEARR